MEIGITGTQQGLVTTQFDCFVNWLSSLERPIRVLHHGCCVGADEQVVEIVQAVYPNVSIVAHPPINTYKMSSIVSSITLDPMPYLVRNQHIVDCSDMLLVFPKQEYEVRRSGTWSTYRRAKRKKIPTVIFSPSGINKVCY